jgi:hypothetical protein
LAHIYA